VTAIDLTAALREYLAALSRAVPAEKAFARTLQREAPAFWQVYADRRCEGKPWEALLSQWDAADLEKWLAHAERNQLGRVAWDVLADCGQRLPAPRDIDVVIYPGFHRADGFVDEVGGKPTICMAMEYRYSPTFFLRRHAGSRVPARCSCGILPPAPTPRTIRNRAAEHLRRRSVHAFRPMDVPRPGFRA